MSIADEEQSRAASARESRDWCVYLLACADGTLYCGSTCDLTRRLAMHNGLLPGGAKYTRGRRPVKLAACAEGFSRSEALRLEARVKKMPRAEKERTLLGIDGGQT